MLPFSIFSSLAPRDLILSHDAAHAPVVCPTFPHSSRLSSHRPYIPNTRRLLFFCQKLSFFPSLPRIFPLRSYSLRQFYSHIYITVGNEQFTSLITLLTLMNYYCVEILHIWRGGGSYWNKLFVDPQSHHV